MRGEASAVFGGLIGTIAHVLVLYGVAPAAGYPVDPFVTMAGEPGALAAFSVYLLIVGLVYPLGYHYAAVFLSVSGVAVWTVVTAVPVWVAFVALDCLQSTTVGACAAIAGVAALVYGFLLTYSHREFGSDF